MDDRRPQSPPVTPKTYRCPACDVEAPMVIAHPWWHCAFCRVRLIPADLHSLLTIQPRPQAVYDRHRARADNAHANGQPPLHRHSLSAEAG